MKKFAFIGGGSFGFTRTLVKDLLTFPAFADAEIALMDIDEERPTKKMKLSADKELQIKVEKQKQKTIERMKRKIQKNWNRDARVDEADRTIASTKPKFLNTGKRGIGKTNWR